MEARLRVLTQELSARRDSRSLAARSRDSTLWPFAVLAACSVVALVVVGTPAAYGQNRDAFKQGVEAIDLERFAEAIVPLRRAVAEDGSESGERVFLSGVFSRPYLPHFFLGWAIYRNAGPCEEALIALRESERQGVINGFGRLRANLETARKDCTKQLLPKAEDQAGQQIVRADELTAKLSRPLLDQQSEADRQRLLGQAKDASSRLQQARSNGDPLAIGTITTELATLSDALDNLLQGQSRLTEALSANAFSIASGAARDAIAGAERDQRRLLDLLADPRQGSLRQEALGTEPENAAAGLATARQQLNAATTLAQAEEAGSTAEIASQHFQGLIDRAAQLESASTTLQDIPPSTTAAPSSRITPPAPSIAPGQLRAVRNRSDAAKALLDQLANRSELDSPSRLFQLLKERLQSLVGEAQAWLANPDGDSSASLVDRLSEATDATHLMVGAQRLFAGDPRGALTFLEGGDSDTPKVGAQVRLLRAASHFELYRLGGELDSDQRQRAVAEVRLCHQLEPDLVPDPSHFSPAFSSFFADAISSSGGANE